MTVDVDIEDQLQYTDTDTGGFFCPFSGEHTTTNGDLSTNISLEGYEDPGEHSEGEAVGIDVIGAS